MSVSLEHTQFQEEVDKAQAFFAIAHQTDASGKNTFDTHEREMMIESAFLKIFIVWESFLQNCFLKYMVGEMSSAGNLVTKFVSPKDMAHADQMVLGCLRFYEWSNADHLITSSEIYFADGHPFKDTLRSIKGHLDDLKVLRNSTAHKTSTTQKKLDMLITRKLGIPTSNGKVSTFILTDDPNNPGKTVMASYVEHLKAAATCIANA